MVLPTATLTLKVTGMRAGKAMVVLSSGAAILMLGAAVAGMVMVMLITDEVVMPLRLS